MPDNYKILTIPFAQDASPDLINEIPDDPLVGTPERASWKQGYPFITMIPLVAGGIPPQGQDFNGVFRDITEHIVHQNKGGMYKFSAEIVADGGYPQGAVLAANDGLSLWVSLQDENTQDFNGAVKDQWARIAFSGLDAALNEKLDKSAVVQALGQSTTSVMSQKIVSDEFAARTPTTSRTDTTVGRLLKVGDFGVGRPLTLPFGIDLDTFFLNGSYDVHDALNRPTGTVPWGYLRVISHNVSSHIYQEWTELNSINPRTYFRVRDQSIWRPWQEIYHTGNLPVVQSTGQSNASIMSQKAVTDGLAAKANSSVTLTAGTGLSGGGNLSANRTFSVNYGTTAGTAVQGNAIVQTTGQSNASIMSQKIVSDEFAARTPTTSRTDTTVGRLLKVGDFGVGRPLTLPIGTDLDTFFLNGSYDVSDALNRPTGTTPWGYLRVISHNVSSYIYQEWTELNSLNPRTYFRVRDQSIWRPWQEIYHTGNLPVVQSTGQSTTSIMSQKAVTDELAAIGFSTNHNAATGTVTIPSGLEIGTRRLIRKIHPTQGTVTINCTGETFTRANLASVTLNANGDYWLLEKVTATRWELVDGWNTGENANGVWVLNANGVVSFHTITSALINPTLSTVQDITITTTFNVVTDLNGGITHQSGTDTGSLIIAFSNVDVQIVRASNTTVAYKITFTTSSTQSLHGSSVFWTSRWYL